MFIYLSLCIIYTILNFFTSIIWKLQIKSIYKSPIFLVIFTSIVSYYALKAGFLNNLNNIIPIHIMSFLSDGKYEQYVEKYFSKYIQFDSIISSVFFIVLGVLYLDFPNNKEKINELNDTIFQLKIDISRCYLENRRLIRKNKKLLNLDDSDNENQEFESYIKNEHPDYESDPESDIESEPESDLESDPEPDPEPDLESDTESDPEPDPDKQKPNKMTLLEAKEYVKKLIKSLKQFDSMINENDLAIKKKIDKQTRIKCRHYKNKILNIFINYIRDHPKRNKFTYILKDMRKDINHIDF